MKTVDFIPFDSVTLTDGFWKDRFDLNKNVSLSNVRKRFEESGRFDALRFNYATTGKKPHIFYDSDVAKWMEAVAYLTLQDPDGMREHEALCEELIDCMERAQREDGYLNSEHQQVSPHLIFSNRDRHELYCAGHLIEAAIAYHKATGRDRFLKIMERYCDLIERVFLKENSAGFMTPGQQIGHLFHILAVAGLLIELAVQLCNRFSLALAQIAHSVQHILGGQMVTNNFTIIADIDHVEGV